MFNGFVVDVVGRGGLAISNASNFDERSPFKLGGDAIGDVCASFKTFSTEFVELFDVEFLKGFTWGVNTSEVLEVGRNVNLIKFFQKKNVREKKGQHFKEAKEKTGRNVELGGNKVKLGTAKNPFGTWKNLERNIEQLMELKESYKGTEADPTRTLARTRRGLDR